MGYENWTIAIEAWIQEKEHYSYDKSATGIVGHYTQVSMTFGGKIKNNEFITYFRLDNMAFNSFSWLCCYIMPCLWIIYYALAILCL